MTIFYFVHNLMILFYRIPRVFGAKFQFSFLQRALSYKFLEPQQTKVQLNTILEVLKVTYQQTRYLVQPPYLTAHWGKIGFTNLARQLMICLSYIYIYIYHKKYVIKRNTVNEEILVRLT